MTVTTDPTFSGARAGRPSRARRLRRVLTCTLLAAVAVVADPADPVTAGPGSTVLVSTGLLGTAADAASREASVSADGRFVAFTSSATNLVRADTNGRRDVFVRDLLLGRTVRVSVSSDGAQADGDSRDPSISADGRYVAFTSSASNLVADDTNGREDVFVRDLTLGTTVRASLAHDGRPADNFSVDPSISADGLRVAFVSGASNLVPDDTNGRRDVFVRDLRLGTTVRVNVSAAGQPGDEHPLFRHFNPVISADGRFVAFQSSASDLVGGDTNQREDVFVHDLATRTTVRVSVSGAGGQASGHSREPSISADGRFVTFHSSAADLVPNDTNGDDDVFVRDRLTGTTVRVSVTGTGGQSGGGSSPSISADGRRIAFTSPAVDLVPDDTNDAIDVFVHEWSPSATPATPARGER